MRSSDWISDVYSSDLREWQAAPDSHGHRPSCRGHGAQYWLRREAVRHTAAGAPPSAAAGRAYRRDPRRDWHRCRRRRRPAGERRLRAMSGATADGQVTLVLDGQAAHVTFDRPAARNAITLQLYEQLARARRTVEGSDTVSVAEQRGGGARRGDRGGHVE